MISGLLGVGGGIMFVPALTLVLSLSEVKAEATSLLAIIPVAFVGALRQYRYGNVMSATARSWAHCPRSASWGGSRSPTSSRSAS